jgi:diguanylate cyclase (GGDEF)-like protein/PAS domain S-box-containing protein
VIALVVPTLYLLAGAIVCAMLHVLAAATVRRPDRSALLVFAGMGLFAALAAIFSAQSHTAVTAAQFLRALKLNIDCIIVATWSAAAFVALYVGHHGRRARAVLGAYGAACIALILANERLPFGIQYRTFSGIATVRLPWGETVTAGVGQSGLATAFGVLLLYGVMVYALVALWRHYRRTRTPGALWLFIAEACFVPLAVLGLLVRLAVVHGFEPGPLGFLLVTAAMSAALVWETQHALSHSEQRFRVLFERAPAAMVAIDAASGRIVQANAVACALSGYEAHELIGKTVGELSEATQSPETAERFAALRAGTREEQRLEWVLRDRNGAPHVTDCSVTVQRDAAGRVGALIACLIDVTERKRMESALQRESGKNLALLRNSSDGVHILTPAGHVIEASDSFCEMLGYSREQVIGMHVSQWDALFTPEQLVAILHDRFGEPRRTVLETRHRRRDGSVIEVEVSAVAMRLGDTPVLFNSSRDITARKHAETRLRESEMRLRILIEQSPVGISFSRDGITFDVNARYAEMFGYRSAAEVLDTPYLDRIAPRARSAVREIIERRREGREAPSEYETVGLRRDGSEFPVFVSARRIVLEEGPLTIACMLDFTERKQFEDRIRQLAFFDQLTRLPNRELLQDRLRQAISACARTGRHGALLQFGLDNFKSINETLGHAAGDALLQEVATRLAAEVRDGDTVARMGGDEFMVLLEDLGPQPWAAAAHAESFGLKIMRLLGSSQGSLGDQVHVSCSVGATLLPGHQMGAHDLIQQADIALNQAKEAGRNTLRFFDPNMQKLVSSRATLEGELRKAVGAGQFLLHYQPQVDGSGRCIGAEALLRWNHPVRGLVPPGEYIGLAEETQMILPIGEWVIDTACAQLAAWRDAPATRELTLAVNVSPLQFQQPQFAEQVRRAIARHGIEARRLKLELTETMLQGDVQKTVMTMRRLKEEGVQFSLDDFGTGYSSLQYLKQLPLDQLKIDQTFVRDIVTDPNDRAIVATIIAIARHLGLDVIAEGVETQAQLEVLRECGCSRYQGYLFGRPAGAQRLFGT